MTDKTKEELIEEIKLLQKRIAELEVLDNERKKVEKALQESASLLQGLFDNMTSGAAIYKVINDGSKGSDYIIIDFNNTSLRIEGKRKDEVIGKSLFDLRPNIDQYGLIPIFQKVWRTGVQGYFPSKVYVDEKYSNWYENWVFKLPTGEIVAIYNDVTERKQAEEKFQKIIETANEGIWVMNQEFCTTFANLKMAEMLGLTPDEMLGRRVDSFMLEEDLSDHLAQMELRQQGKASKYERRFKRKDGTIIWGFLSSTQLKDSEGRFAGSFAMITDITERKQAEEAIRESEKRFREIFNSVRDGILLVDSATRKFIDGNKMICEMLGYREDELKKLGVADIHLEQDLPEITDKFEKCVQGKIKELECLTMKRKDGSIFYVSLKPFFLTINGKPVISATVRDITERKQAEKVLRENENKYKTLFENSNAAIIIADVETGIILEANKNAEKLLGRSRQEIIGMNRGLIHHQDEAEYYKKQFQDHVKKGRIEFSEATVVKKDGTKVPVQISASVTEVHGKKVIQGIFQDVTELKKIRDEIENMAKFPNENPYPVLRIAKDGTLLFVNHGGLRLLSDWHLQVGQAAPSILRDMILPVLKSGLEGQCDLKYSEQIYSFHIVPVINSNYANLYGRDITERMKAEKSLKEAKERLHKDKLALEQKNLALKELLEHMERTKNNTKEDIAVNVEEFIMPILEKLKLKGVSSRYIDLIMHHLNELTSSFGRKIVQKSVRLSPREIEICSLIKGGLPSKEISGLLNISCQTIETHRKNIRKKLAISKKDINLTSFLQKL